MELPQDFKERMERQLGDSYADFLAAYGKGRVYGLRYNPLKIEKGQLASALLGYQITLGQVAWADEGFYYPADAHPGKLALHEAGAYYIQEPSAMVAVELLDPKPGEKILDLCAAPGGKSTQIAGRQRGEGLLISNEVTPQRAKTLSRNIERMGVPNAAVLNETPKRLAERFALFFDKVLVDAPCSGEGMFRKDADACGEWSLKQVDACAQRQRDILAQAVRMLRPGGVLVYSTCTFAPQENGQIAEWLVREYPEFVLEKSEQIWPHLQRGEGHYAARFCRQGPDVAALQEQDLAYKNAAASRHDADRPQSKKGLAVSQREKGLLADHKEFFGFLGRTLSEEGNARMMARIQTGRLAAFGDMLYLLPPGIGRLGGLKVERAGLQLGCSKKNRFEPSHALAMALHPHDVKQALELGEPERYLRGEAISCSMQNGWTLATIHGCSIGWGKASQGVLKNHYPKGLRRN